MLYTIKKSLSPSPDDSRKMLHHRSSNNSRWHLSFSSLVPITFIAVVTLSLAGVYIGMNYINITLFQSSPPRTSNDMIYPRKSADSNDMMSMIINNAFGVVDVVGEGEDDDDDDEVTTSSNNNALLQAQSETASINENERHNSVYPRIIELKVDDDLLAAISRSSLLRGGTSNNNNDQRKIEVSRIALKEQERLLDSEDFSYRDPLYEDDCVPMQKWQETSFPICNLVSSFTVYVCILCVLL